MKYLLAVMAGGLLAAVLLGGLPGVAQAQGLKAAALTPEQRIHFDVAVTTADPFDLANQASASPPTPAVRRGQTFTLHITGQPAAGYHTYPITQRTPKQDEVQLSTLTYKATPGLKPLWPIRESPAEIKDEGAAGGLLAEFPGKFTWEQDILVLPDAKPGPAKLTFEVRTQVCDTSCTWVERAMTVTVLVSGEPPVPLTPELEKRAQQTAPAPQVVSLPGGGSGAGGGTVGSPGGGSGLLGFILAGVFWGAVSLITPCVFPMIPITVSFFLKQSEKAHHRPITLALVYCLTIIVVLTIAALVLLEFFSRLSVNPIMNFAIGGIFIFFALSLFGMYDIELPSGLARFTSAHEGQGGLLGTMFMALTFTIISFACVAPFLGGFGGTAGGSGMTLTHRLLGGLAFAATFASPFFILAMFPALLKRLPKSGSWLNTVKVVMGFLELAAALKFLRTGELVTVSEPVFFTYDFVLGLYVALSLLCGLYLLGVYRLPHDTPAEHLSVPRLLFSFAFLGLAFYLTPGLFKYGEHGRNQQPSGTVFAWIDSFLLPDARGSELPWVASLESGLKTARSENKLVFIDFTGKTCTNCALNEQQVFSRPEVQRLLKQYSLVQLYTDIVPNRFYSPEEQSQFGNSAAKQLQDARANFKLQEEKFGTLQLPLYVILQPLPDGSYQEVARYDEGKISSQAAFMQFLEQTLANRRGTGSLAQAAGPTGREQPPAKGPVTGPVREAKADPPAPPAKAAAAESQAELRWGANLEKALEEARGQKKLVFLDFTGKACPPCLVNERTVFTQAAVKDLLRHYALAQLYTDIVPEKYYRPEDLAAAGSEDRRRADARVNLKLEQERFRKDSQPLYVIVEPQPDGKFREVRRYDEGLITNPEAFLQFLREPLVQNGTLPRLQASLQAPQ
jgi:thiol:disulfide interchange protein DsbD